MKRIKGGKMPTSKRKDKVKLLIEFAAIAKNCPFADEVKGCAELLEACNWDIKEASEEILKSDYGDDYRTSEFFFEKEGQNLARLFIEKYLG